MCVGRPGRVLRLLGDLAEVETGGARRWCSALLQPGLRPGDRVLTHADLVVAVLSELEAGELDSALAELQAAIAAASRES